MSMLEPLTTSTSASEHGVAVAPGLVVLGTVRAVEGLHRVQVNYIYAGKTYEQWAMTTFAAQGVMGRQVALSFLEGQVTKPVAVGLIYSPLYSLLELAPGATDEPPRQAPTEQRSLTIDGSTVTLSAAQSLELRCGEASITLTKDGKILIRGEYVQSRARGVNRILGGSVQVN